jgi:uncharacterized protein
MPHPGLYLKREQVSQKLQAMKAAISGSTGFMGSEITGMLNDMGYEVIPLSREDLYGATEALSQKLEGATVVIHLAGAPLHKRWTRKQKKAIYHSRIDTTTNLVQAMEGLPDKPRVFVCASGVNIFPEQGTHTEDSDARASGFLGDVCRDWEAEAARASAFCRTLHFRFGMVLGRGGGALEKMKLPFNLFVGGPVAGGKQMVTWVQMEDVLGAMRFALQTQALEGPVNVCAPNPVNNATFSKALGKALHRPSWLPVPAFAVRLLYGEMATMVTRGVTVLPGKLTNLGYTFKHPDIDEALKVSVG